MNFIKCSYVHCRSKQEGIYIPVIQFRAKGNHLMPVGEAIIAELRLCENCAQTANVHDIVSNKRWADICDKVQKAGGPLPDRDSIKLFLGKPKEVARGFNGQAHL